MKKPFYQLEQMNHLIRHFTPNWFTVIMGTGVVALILPELPFAQSLMAQLAVLLWHCNIGLFLIFSLLYALRWIIYPTEARQIFSHASMSLFLGAIPMALATIINGGLKFGIILYGEGIIPLAQQLWYLDVFLAVAIAWIVPFCMYNRQQHQLRGMTAVWLLPIVACEVAAATGGLLLPHIPSGQQAVAILLGSYVLWGMSVLPAFAILTILMLRLALHQLPSKELAISSWLALGPIGTGALALLILGAQASQVLSAIDQQSLGLFFQQAGIVVSLILLGFGGWWLGIAVLTTLKHTKTALPFNLGWWGLTFPLGVFTLAILSLGQQLQVSSISSTGEVLAVILLMLWMVVVSKTAQGFYRGNLFFSPCLKSYLEQQS